MVVKYIALLQGETKKISAEFGRRQRGKLRQDAQFEVLTAMAIKGPTFWNVQSTEPQLTFRRNMRFLCPASNGKLSFLPVPW
jgi:hypothetical protein